MEINKDVERENIHTVSSSVVPQKFKNKITLWSRNSTFRHTPQRTENMGLNKYTSSTIHDSQKVDTIQVDTIHQQMKR